MSKVITINNWWDGPIEGLAYFDDVVCIYERIFDETMDEWGNEYYLTPVNAEEQKIIMNDWKDWCAAVDGKTDLDVYYAAHPHPTVMDTILKNNPLKRKYRKRATFKGELREGYIPVDVNVEWSD